MTPEQILRISEIRSRVIRATYEAFREDGYHKSSEGACEVALCLPNMFEADQRPSWTVSVYSYVLGPNRNHNWMGATLDEALVQAELAVKEWCFPYERRVMEKAMGMDANADADEDPFA
jgi:hypothetical protein